MEITAVKNIITDLFTIENGHPFIFASDPEHRYFIKTSFYPDVWQYMQDSLTDLILPFQFDLYHWSDMGKDLDEDYYNDSTNPYDLYGVVDLQTGHLYLSHQSETIIKKDVKLIY